MTTIADLRKSYGRAELNEDARHSDLRPSTRVVLIKGYEAQGITWFTNHNSRNGSRIGGHPMDSGCASG